MIGAIAGKGNVSRFFHNRYIMLAYTDFIGLR